MESKVIAREEYRKTQYYKDSIKLIKEFTDEFLEGNINKLKTFCFENLQGNKKYGNYGATSGKRSFDCDDTELARSIYCVVWGYIFNIKAEDIGPWNSNKTPYRGDTMNSFKTLFGNDKNAGFAYRAKFYGIDEDVKLWKNIMGFKYQYHTIGNFILIPNKGNVNVLRGNFFRFKDYFDLFLLEIQEYKKAPYIKYEKGVKWALTQNSFYTQYSMKEMKEIFYLDDYFDNEVPKEFIGISKKDRLKITANKEARINKKTNQQRSNYFSEEEYIKLVNEYITKSEIVIANRADKIVEAIKVELKEATKIGIL